MVFSPSFSLWYRLDATDRIVEVSSDWDVLADHYEAPRARAAAVVGRRLSEFLSGDAARMFIHAAVQSARVFGRVVTLPYRCDGDSERRRFEMDLVPSPDQGVVIWHRLVSTERRPSLPAEQRGGWRCSQCLRVRFRGASTWEETDVPIRFVALDVCPECSGRLFERLGAHSGEGRSDGEQ